MVPRKRLLPPGLALVTLLLLASAASTAQVALNPDHPTRYVVRPGDTLWDIAGYFLRDPWRWGEIWDANRQIDDPDLIFPGDVLVLSYEAGQPRIGLERGRDGLRVVKLSPRVRVESLDQAIPAIPANIVAPFLTQAQVASKAELDEAAYVVGFPDEHIVVGNYDALYARGLRATETDRFEIVRPGPAYRDPETGEVLGYEAAFVADAQLERRGDPAKLRVERSAIEVAVGDRLLPASETELLGKFFPTSAPDDVRGKIIAVLDGVSQIGQYAVVVLNRGARDEIAPGHVFAVYRGGEERFDQVKAGGKDWRDWRSETPLDAEFWYDPHSVVGWLEDEPDLDTPLPPRVEVRRPGSSYVVPFERSGLLMVFRVFPRLSLALVMNAERPMKVLDSVSAPEG